jgi:PKD repeat protein
MRKIHLMSVALVIHAVTNMAMANEPPVSVICNMDTLFNFNDNGANTSPSVSVTFDGNCSYDPDTDPLWNASTGHYEYSGMVYRWIFPAGVLDSGKLMIEDEKKTTVTFKKAGAYQVTLWTKDGDGADSFDQKTVLISDVVPPEAPVQDNNINYSPVADAGGPYVAKLGKPVTFSGSAIDPDQEYFNETQYLQYGWTYGDGCTYNEYDKIPYDIWGNSIILSDGQIILYDGDGAVEVTANLDTDRYDYKVIPGNECISTGTSPSHVFTSPGLKTIELTAIDQYYPFGQWLNNTTFLAPGVGVATTTVLVNRPPYAAFTGPDGGAINQTLEFDASLSTDPDGQALTYMWDFGDGTVARGVNVAHMYVEPGKYEVSLVVSDGYHTSDATSQTVNVTDLSWLIPVITLMLQ